MEQNASKAVYTERNAPKRAIVRSDGALYVLLLLLTFGMIALTYVLAKAFGINRLYLQLGLYALLLAVGYTIYRLRLIDYLYELNDRAFSVTQAVGAKQKRIAEIPLDAIEEIGESRENDPNPLVRTYRGKASGTTAIRYREAGEMRVILLNASETLREKLTEASHARD